jgi:hypothetical protein
MKLSQIPEFRAQALAQEEIKKEEQQDSEILLEIKELRKELKDIKLLLTSLLMQKGSK